MNREKKIIVLEDGEGYEGWPPSGVDDFIIWLLNHLSAIPPEHRASATLEISSGRDDGVESARICIGYMRPETDEEKDGRLARHKAVDADTRLRDIEEFERIRDKYGLLA